MTMSYKCPHCKASINSVHTIPTVANIGEYKTKEYEALAHCCEKCKTVISVEINQIVLHRGTIKAIESIKG